MELKKADDQINVDEFSKLFLNVQGMIFLKRALEWDLKVPNFEFIMITFNKILNEI